MSDHIIEQAKALRDRVKIADHPITQRNPHPNAVRVCPEDWRRICDGVATVVPALVAEVERLRAKQEKPHD